ncbi:unnamed protein product [Lactuca virosa]|uniref:Uncharacterized protein n=1 Tax=Lactuca virosa TaxID=75947 RepID=A0AAU9N8G5_9ASTR|nr:unnamed protein product [Lactuca virosa]
MSAHKVFVATQLDKKNQNSLHMAANLAPPHRLNVVTGAALQMRHELQWFKEVEKFIEPSYKEALNTENKPQEWFSLINIKTYLKKGRNG